MIPNEVKESWHYLAVKILSTLLRGIASKHHNDFYCLNYLHSYRKENKLKSHENVRKNKEICGIVMPSEKGNLLKFNQSLTLDKISYIIYADFESLIKKIGWYANNPENSSTANISEHIPCGYSMSTICAFDHIENKHTLYCKKLCESLKERVKNIIDFEKNQMLPLTKEELKSHQYEKACYACRKIFLRKLSKSINCRKVRDHYHYTGKYRGTAQSICYLKFNVSKEIPVVIHNGSNY